MEKGSLVKDINERKPITGIFVIVEPRQATGKNGAPYWSLKITDASGAMDAKIWPPLSESVSSLNTGNFYLISGHARFFREQLQLSIDRLEELSPEKRAELDMADFMRSSPYNIGQMAEELRGIRAREFSHRPWADLLAAILDNEAIWEKFRMAPAAKSVHHAYVGGLLEHTLGVAKLCLLLADKYQELDRQTLLAGAILHDIGKIRELSYGLNTDYSTEGRLLGHIFIGLEIIEPFFPASGLETGLRDHLRHLILSHHGELEYGAAKLPQTPEAFALHYADNIDAKLAQCRSSLENLDSAGFGTYQSTLNRCIFRAAPTPKTTITGNPVSYSARETESQPMNETGLTANQNMNCGEMPLNDEPPPPADSDIPAEVDDILFEDSRNMILGEPPLGDEPPPPQDSDIPAEDCNSQCNIVAADSPKANIQRRVVEKENKPHKSKNRSQGGQCSLLMKG